MELNGKVPVKNGKVSKMRLFLAKCLRKDLSNCFSLNLYPGIDAHA